VSGPRIQERDRALPRSQTENILAAFTSRQSDLEAICDVAETFQWSVNRCLPGGFDQARDMLGSEKCPRILLVDISDRADPLEDVEALMRIAGCSVQVLIIGLLNDVNFHRSLLDLGAADYLMLPLDRGQLETRLERAAIRARVRGEDIGSHRSIAVVGARGGVGGSTVSSALAWLASAEYGRPTALLDFDLHYGTGAIGFDCEPGSGLIEAMRDPYIIEPMFLERAMVRVSDTLVLLSAEAPLALELLPQDSYLAFSRLHQCVGDAFAVSVVDLPRQQLNNAALMMQSVDDVVVVTNLTLASARDSIRILSWLKNECLGVRSWIVANKLHDPQAEISIKDFEQSIERTFDCLIPYDPKSAARVARLGCSIASLEISNRARAPLVELIGGMLASPLVSETPRALVERRNLLQGMKGLLWQSARKMGLSQKA
jgi:pilus assembly protein CpaE